MTARKANPRKRGRKTLYTPALGERICDLIREGYSEREISRMEGMPETKTFAAWKDQYPEFLRQSIRAREQSAFIFDDKNKELAERLEDLAEEAIAKHEAIPKGVVDALKVAIGENARQAGLRNDRLFADRKKIQLDATVSGKVEVPQSLAELYEAQKKALEQNNDPSQAAAIVQTVPL